MKVEQQAGQLVVAQPIRPPVTSESIEIDWGDVGDDINFKLRMAVRDHVKIGECVTFAEGEKFCQDLANAIVCVVRTKVTKRIEAAFPDESQADEG
jgi:hypothetical protein